MSFSLVITVLNEEHTIERLLSAIDGQTKEPSQVIFVDGGSTDKTYYLIQDWAEGRDNTKVLLKKGLSIAQGRNFGIEKARENIIVHTDAGCVPHLDWFKKITQPFDDSGINIVSGFYRMTGDSSFQKCIAVYLGVCPKRLDSSRFFPSTRSIAFRKKIWQEIGGFPEKLNRAGEDMVFNYLAKKLGARFYFQGTALVDWEMPKGFWEAAQKFYFYAKGDAQAGVWWCPQQKLLTHNIKVVSIYIRYLAGLIILFLAIVQKSLFWLPILFFSFYIVWSVRKNYSLVKIWQALFLLPIIQIISDFAIMLGFAAGNFSAIRKKD